MPNTYDLPTDPAECEGGIVSPGLPCATHNVGCQIIDSHIYRITQEMTKNQSSRVTAFSPDDKERIDSFYEDLLAIIERVGNSISDFHGLIFWPLTDIAGIQLPVENENVNAALAYLLNADFNMRISQSARLNDGILESDKKDLVDAVEKSRTMIDQFYTSFNPMDMPQSNPREAVVNPTM